MEISYIWKMIRKIWRICLCHVHACLSKLTLLFRTNYVNGIWLFTYEVWIWTLGSNQLHLIWTLVALAQTQAYCHVMIMHHIVVLHWLCPSLFAGICPLSIDVFRRWVRWHRWRTISSSGVPGKQNPLVHSDTIPLAPSGSLLLH